MSFVPQSSKEPYKRAIGEDVVVEEYQSMLHFVLEIFNEQIGIGDRTQNSFPTSSASSGHH